MITDGTFVCADCGEWRTGCQLCGTATLIDRRQEIYRQNQEEREADAELARQERAIRHSNEKNYYPR